MPKKLVASRARFQRAEHISDIGSLLFTIWGFTIMFNHAPWLKSISNSHVKGEYKTSETNDKGDRGFTLPSRKILSLSRVKKLDRTCTYLIMEHIFKKPDAESRHNCTYNRHKRQIPP